MCTLPMVQEARHFSHETLFQQMDRSSLSRHMVSGPGSILGFVLTLLVHPPLSHPNTKMSTHFCSYVSHCVQLNSSQNIKHEHRRPSNCRCALARNTVWLSRETEKSGNTSQLATTSFKRVSFVPPKTLTNPHIVYKAKFI